MSPRCWLRREKTELRPPQRNAIIVRDAAKSSAVLKQTPSLPVKALESICSLMSGPQYCLLSIALSDSWPSPMLMGAPTVQPDFDATMRFSGGWY